MLRRKQINSGQYYAEQRRIEAIEQTLAAKTSRRLSTRVIHCYSTIEIHTDLDPTIVLRADLASHLGRDAQIVITDRNAVYIGFTRPCATPLPWSWLATISLECWGLVYICYALLMLHAWFHHETDTKAFINETWKNFTSAAAAAAS